ncbi:MAG: CoA transferase [Chloroflexota bacterium]|nr:CoA transferase [Chloroflexota bacterium]
MTNNKKKKQINPLDGIRVIEVAQWVAAPSASALLADWGADVIKIEHPVRGDGSRGMMVIGGMPVSDMNYPWELDNRDKKASHWI